MRPGRQKRLRLRIRNSPYRQKRQSRSRAARQLKKALYGGSA